MRLIADAHITLPFSIDLCARGPDVDPLTCTVNGFDATLYFPPSLGDETDGQGIFGEWAWWTGRTLRLVLERELPDELVDSETLRAEALAAGNDLLRRFLNAYRWRLNRPAIHPVPLDPRTVTLELLHDDGRREALAEPVSAFFYQTMPTKPPLEMSVNATTLPRLLADLQEGIAPPLTEQLRLDAEALDAQGEQERAQVVREVMEQVSKLLPFPERSARSALSE